MLDIHYHMQVEQPHITNNQGQLVLGDVLNQIRKSHADIAAMF